MSKPKQLSKTVVDRAINDCKFNPRKPGPMKVIADIGNPEYWIIRAQEELVIPTVPSIKLAIQLLALVKAHRESKTVSK